MLPAATEVQFAVMWQAARQARFQRVDMVLGLPRDWVVVAMRQIFEVEANECGNDVFKSCDVRRDKEIL